MIKNHKNLKKALALLLTAVMVSGCLAGCGKDEGQVSASGGSQSEETQSGGAEEEGAKEESQEESTEESAAKPVIDEPVTISILTRRHDGATSDAADLWFFKYMEYWFAEQGYDVTIEVQQTNEPATQVSLVLGTDSVPDLVWGIPAGRTNVVQYGIEEGILLDWTPYLEGGLMPSLAARFEADPDIRDSILAPDGKLYALPYLTPSVNGSGCYGTSERMYFRQSWLDAVEKENPTTQEELLDVLRAFKDYAASSGNGGYALVSDVDFLEKFIWTGLGFYGTEPNKYGYNLMIKDGELEVPAYTESYRDFITFMNTLYTEGLISTDYFSMDSTTAQGLMRDNKCGAMCYWTLGPVGDDFADIVCANPIPFGSNTADNIHVSRLARFTDGTMWSSAKTKHPEIVAMLADFIYSDEGAFLYRYGPEQGKDPLGLVDGWYYNEDNAPTTDLVEDGTYSTMAAYGRDRLFPYDSAGLRPDIVTNGSGEQISYVDSVTGETYTVLDTATLRTDTNDGHWRQITIDKWSDRATSVRLPGAYLSVEDTQTASDIITTIQTYVRDESARFITGKRSLDEIDDFWAQLKSLGIEEYLQLNRDAYADYLSGIFQ